MTPDSFIARWQKSGAAERANYALFITELCTLLDVPHPDPTQADDAANAYVFERAVKFAETDGTTSDGRMTSTAAAPSCWKRNKEATPRRPK